MSGGARLAGRRQNSPATLPLFQGERSGRPASAPLGTAAPLCARRRLLSSDAQSPSPAPGTCAHVPPCPQSRRTLLVLSARYATSSVGGAQGNQRRPPALPPTSTDSSATLGSGRTPGATSWRRSGGRGWTRPVACGRPSWRGRKSGERRTNACGPRKWSGGGPAGRAHRDSGGALATRARSSDTRNVRRVQKRRVGGQPRTHGKRRR